MQLLHLYSTYIDSSSEGDSERGSTSKSKMKKKSIIEKNIEKLLTIRTEKSKRREETRQKRHIERIERQDHATEVYQSAMNQLLEKL